MQSLRDAYFPAHNHPSHHICLLCEALSHDSQALLVKTIKHLLFKEVEVPELPDPLKASDTGTGEEVLPSLRPCKAVLQYPGVLCGARSGKAMDYAQ